MKVSVKAAYMFLWS